MEFRKEGEASAGWNATQQRDTRPAYQAKQPRCEAMRFRHLVLVHRGDRAVAQISKSAVSRVSNPQTLRRLQSRGTGDGSADWKSAIQQVGNLRYVQRVLNRFRH